MAINDSDGKTPELDKDLKILERFVAIYCRGVHGKEGRLCGDCRDLLGYAEKRRRFCPLDPKPSCKDCHIHCYKPEYRERIRQVMRYSGKRFYRLFLE